MVTWRKVSRRRGHRRNFLQRSGANSRSIPNERLANLLRRDDKGLTIMPLRSTGRRRRGGPPPPPCPRRKVVRLRRRSLPGGRSTDWSDGTTRRQIGTKTTGLRVLGPWNPSDSPSILRCQWQPGSHPSAEMAPWIRRRMLRSPPASRFAPLPSPHPLPLGHRLTTRSRTRGGGAAKLEEGGGICSTIRLVGSFLLGWRWSTS